MTLSDPAATGVDQAPRVALWIGRSVIALWITYLLVAPTIGFGWIESWHNEQRAVQVCLLIASAIGWLLMLALSPADSATRQGLPPIAMAFLAAGTFSSVVNGSPISAFAEMSLIALLVVLALVVANTVRYDYGRSLKLATAFSLLWASGYVLGVVIRYIAALQLGRPLDLDVVLFGYANPRFPSAMHALLLPFIAHAATDRHACIAMRITAFLLLISLWAINVALGTRAIWFAYIASLPVLPLLFPRSSLLRLLAAITAAAVAGVALYYLCFEFMAAAAVAAKPSALPPLQNTTLTSREVLWSLAWSSMLHAPLLGMGPFQFAALHNPVGAHPHNWILQIAAEWGCLGLLIALYGLARLAARLRAERSRADTDLTVPGVAVCVALAYGLVDGNLVMPVSQTTLILAFGMLLGGASSRGAFISVVASSTRAVAAGALAVIAASILSAYAVNTFAQSESAAAAFRLHHPGAWLVPRFWEQDP